MWYEKILEPKVQIPEEKKFFTDKRLFAMILPLIAEQLLLLMVGIVDTMVVSHAGEAVVSGVSLVDQINVVFITVIAALASGGAVVVSQYIGSGDKDQTDRSAGQLLLVAGDYEAADYYIRKLLRFTWIGCAVWDTIFYLITPLLLRLYDITTETFKLVMIVCLIHNLFNALVHPAGFVLASGLRACGDVKYTMFTSLFATAVCRVILAWLFGVWMGLGVAGVTIAMVCDWGIRAILIVSRYKSGRWKEFRVIG